MQGLYPILDVDAVTRAGFPLLEFARRVLLTRPAICQLRAKHSSARDTLVLLRALKPLCEASHTLLFANDRPDLAILAGCDGVHVGQEDLPIAEVRRFAPKLRVGVSTHNQEQLVSALMSKPDYVAFGPVFPTLSKHNPSPVLGFESLKAAAAYAHAAGIPLVAIGGITSEHAQAIAEIGAMAAVISALIPENGNLEAIEARTQMLNRALCLTTPLK